MRKKTNYTLSTEVSDLWRFCREVKSIERRKRKLCQRNRREKGNTNLEEEERNRKVGEERI